jgi:putrescine importer
VAITQTPGAVQFRKALRVQDLILFGVICVQPTAPISPFGIIQKLSHGQGVTAIALAMLAMLPTAFSYGTMAARYPAAGSAYTFVARGLHPRLGFLAGWAAALDYFLIPIASVIYCAVTMARVVPAIPYLVWAVMFAALATGLNLRGIRTGVRTNQLLLALMTVVIVAAVVLAVRYVAGQQGLPGLFSLAPFYQPGEFDPRTLATATSLAALTYIGFDAVTTLAEEVENPKKTLARATIWVCLITGLVSMLIVYLGQLVWPAWQTFRDYDTAFLDVAQRVGGGGLFTAMAVVLLLANFGSALTGQAGASRLLFGMGRSGVYPQRLLSHLNVKTLQPSYNVAFVGLVALVGAWLLGYEAAAELLNFGAFLAFMGVNLAALRVALSEWRAGQRLRILSALVSLFGFLSCFAIWWSLPAPARHVGLIWICVGVIYQLILTRGFRRALRFSFEARATE